MRPTVDRHQLALALLILSSAAVAAGPAVKPPPAPAPTPASAAAPAPAPKERYDAPLASLAPLPNNETAGWAHAPYSDGDCSICHERKDPKNPGKITMGTNELCFSCHEDFKDMLATRSKVHNPVKKSCTNCHNPHNSKQKKLVLGSVPNLCFSSCHDVMRDDVLASTADHQPVLTGDKCLNCHDVHGANVEHLLTALPYDLCVGCHGKEVKDNNGPGKEMVGFTKLLAENKVKHGPVEKKDCTACHTPHGGNNFRMLVDAYPATFYAKFDTENYALCFECHKEAMVKEAKTTTLTKFRDGDKNLHFVHVNKERGRTCRACHEVHAAPNEHILRASVPYGPRGWQLPLHFTRLPTGGQCEKTCHATKAYNNGGAASPARADAAPAK